MNTNEWTKARDKYDEIDLLVKTGSAKMAKTTDGNKMYSGYPVATISTTFGIRCTITIGDRFYDFCRDFEDNEVERAQKWADDILKNGGFLEDNGKTISCSKYVLI